jgi:hypothetical protein
VSDEEPTAIFPPLIANVHASVLIPSENIFHDENSGTYGVRSSSVRYGELVGTEQTYVAPLCSCIARHDESSEHDDDNDSDFVDNDQSRR